MFAVIMTEKMKDNNMKKWRDNWISKLNNILE